MRELVYPSNSYMLFPDPLESVGSAAITELPDNEASSSKMPFRASASRSFSRNEITFCGKTGVKEVLIQKGKMWTLSFESIFTIISL